MNTNQTTKRTARRRASRDTGPATTVDVARHLDALETARKAGVLTIPEYESKRAPLLNTLAELEAAEREANGVGPLGATIGTPIVVAGEVIESAWGNQVRTDLLALNTESATHVAKAGSTMTGNLQVGGTPTAVAGALVRTDGGIVNAITNTGGSTDATASMTMNREGLSAGQPGAVGGVFMSFRRAGAQIGSITIATGPATAYNTTSDPRAKARTGSADDIGEIVQTLGARAYRGRWRNTDTDEPTGDEWVFINSTDVEELAPYAVTGEADAVDDDGNPVMQQVNWSGLVPMLFAALSQAFARIDVLEARVG